MTNTTDKWIWTDWHGGKCPLADGTDFKVRLFHITEEYQDDEPEMLDWTHDEKICFGDIIAYAVLNPDYITPAPVDHMLLLKRCGEALEPVSELFGPYENAPNSDNNLLAEFAQLTVGQLRKARAALEELQKAGVM